MIYTPEQQDLIEKRIAAIPPPQNGEDIRDYINRRGAMINDIQTQTDQEIKDAKLAPALTTNAGLGDEQGNAYWQPQINAATNDIDRNSEAQAQRWNAAQARQEQMAAAQRMLNAPSVVQAQTAQMADQNRANILSQMASQRGQYNPAMGRAGLQAMTGADQALAGQAAANVANENLQKQQAYMQAMATARGQDISQLGGEQEFINANRNRQIQLTGMGVADKQTRAQNLMDLEKLKAQIAQQKVQNDQAEQARSDSFWGTLTKGIVSAVPVVNSIYNSYEEKNKKDPNEYWK
jgi:hypothetical protein